MTGHMRLAAAAASAMLLAQFLLGMVVNLWVTIPDHHPGFRPAEYFSGSAQSVTWAIAQSGLIWLIVHAALGLVLVLLALALLVMAIAARRGSWIAVAGVGLLGVLGGGFNGASNLDYHEDFSSMLMSGGMALAMGSYLVGLYITHPASETP
jgi:hypothetical protein